MRDTLSRTRPSGWHRHHAAIRFDSRAWPNRLEKRERRVHRARRPAQTADAAFGCRSRTCPNLPYTTREAPRARHALYRPRSKRPRATRRKGGRSQMKTAAISIRPGMIAGKHAVGQLSSTRPPSSSLRMVSRMGGASGGCIGFEGLRYRSTKPVRKRLVFFKSLIRQDFAADYAVKAHEFVVRSLKFFLGLADNQDRRAAPFAKARRRTPNQPSPWTVFPNEEAKC